MFHAWSVTLYAVSRALTWLERLLPRPSLCPSICPRSPAAPFPAVRSPLPLPLAHSPLTPHAPPSWRAYPLPSSQRATIRHVISKPPTCAPCPPLFLRAADERGLAGGGRWTCHVSHVLRPPGIQNHGHGCSSCEEASVGDVWT